MSRSKPRSAISVLTVGLRSRHGDQVQVVEGQLCQFRDLRLDQDGRLGRIDADGQVVQRHFDHVAVHLVGVVHIVGQRLGVGQHDELLEIVLVCHAVAQAADEVAEVQRAGRTVAGQDDGAFGGGGGYGFDFDFGLFGQAHQEFLCVAPVRRDDVKTPPDEGGVDKNITSLWGDSGRVLGAAPIQAGVRCHGKIHARMVAVRGRSVKVLSGLRESDNLFGTKFRRGQRGRTLSLSTSGRK
jgi:hypothetical protein